jgi:glutaminyl-tRNA synthetase
MPTLRGLRRRGYTPASIREFIKRAGIARAASTVDVSLLEACIRDELNETAPRAMAVLEPVKVVISNYPEDKTEVFTVENHPGHPEMGTREVPFSRELYIEATDFMEDAPNKFFRLKPGGEVRLKSAYIIRCDEVVKNEDGSIRELICSYDPDSYTGGPTAGRKIKGTIHWVDAATAVPAQVRLYDSLLKDQEGGGEHDDYMERINFDSMTILDNAVVEASLKGADVLSRFQFMRQGYFVVDSDSAVEKPVFNRIVGLKDTWAKVATK